MAPPRTKQSNRQKPSKPTPAFPLTPHNNGQWCKKIRGRIHFFGVWNSPAQALDNYLRVAADLHAGRQPKDSSLNPEVVTVKDVANRFLTEQQRRVESKEISARWFQDCFATIRHFGGFVSKDRRVDDLRPDDFERYRSSLLQHGLGGKQGLGPHALDRSIVIVKAMFDHAYQNELIASPMRFGKMFKQSSALAKRRARADKQAHHGKKLLEAQEILQLLDIAEPPMKAMILLGINGGMGNADCAHLPKTAIRKDKSLIEFPRPKTGVERVVPLWPETIVALERAIAVRPQPKAEQCKDRVFLTVRGRPWVRELIKKKGQQITAVSRVDAVGEEFEKLLKRLKLKRKGLGFYVLRHTFRTWADETNDQHAVSRIMGHLITGMSEHYIEAIELPRLRRVADFVRGKLFPATTPESAAKPSAPQQQSGC